MCCLCTLKTLFVYVGEIVYVDAFIFPPVCDCMCMSMFANVELSSMSFMSELNVTCDANMPAFLYVTLLRDASVDV